MATSPSDSQAPQPLEQEQEKRSKRWKGIAADLRIPGGADNQCSQLPLEWFLSGQLIHAADLRDSLERQDTNTSLLLLWVVGVTFCGVRCPCATRPSRRGCVNRLLDHESL